MHVFAFFFAGDLLVGIETYRFCEKGLHQGSYLDRISNQNNNALNWVATRMESETSPRWAKARNSDQGQNPNRKVKKSGAKNFKKKLLFCV